MRVVLKRIGDGHRIAEVFPLRPLHGVFLRPVRAAKPTGGLSLTVAPSAAVTDFFRPRHAIADGSARGRQEQRLKPEPSRASVGQACFIVSLQVVFRNGS